MSEDLQLIEPSEIPLPKEAVRIRSVSARPYPDGRRVRLDIRVTPFLERPNLEMEAFNAEGHSVGVMSVIESMDHDFELTLHLRGEQPRGRHTLHVKLFYLDGPPPVTAETTFEVVQPA